MWYLAGYGGVVGRSEVRERDEVGCVCNVMGAASRSLLCIGSLQARRPP